MAGVPSATLRHHLRVLERQGLIVERRMGRIRRFFASRGRHGPVWKALALLRDPHLRQLHASLHDRPGSRADIALDAFIAWGWSRSTTYHRLARLEASGLIAQATEGARLEALDLPGLGDGAQDDHENGKLPPTAGTRR
jgi:predicted transcriptional regulator